MRATGGGSGDIALAIDTGCDGSDIGQAIKNPQAIAGFY